MTDELKKLSDFIKSTSLARIAETDSIKKLVEATKPPTMDFGLPKMLERPYLDPVRIPTQRETNAYQSAGVLVKRLAETVRQWRAQVSEDKQPVVIAILQGGIQINVSTLAEESFHGIRIEGAIDGNPCMVLTHQASVQLLCFVAKIEAEEQRRKIGFIIDGQETQE